MLLCGLLLAIVGSSAEAKEKTSDILTFSGMCDGSAAVGLRDGRIVVASDATNILRIYAPEGGAPLGEIDLYAQTEVAPRSRRNFSAFEGMARVGDRVYVIGSHARKPPKGKNRPNRRRFLALQSKVDASGQETLVPTGKSYKLLIDDLAESEALRSLNLQYATMILHRRMPHLSPGKQGLNIEALAATKSGKGVMIGLRNPRHAGKAAILPMQNPDRLISGVAKPDFSEPIRLDLGGLGIAGLEYAPAIDAYYILAAPVDREADFRLYRWSGDPKAKPELLEDIEPKDFAAQSMVVSEDGKRLLLLSDDGASLRDVGPKGCSTRLSPDGRCACDGVANEAQRTFRGLSIIP